MGRDYSRIGGQGVRGGRGWTGIASRSMGSRIGIRYTNQQVANFSLAKHLRFCRAQLTGPIFILSGEQV